METDYGACIEDITQSICATMLGIEAVRSDTLSSEEADYLLATIQITGPSACSVVLGLSSAALLDASAAMLQVAPEDVSNADQRDVAAELVNMIGGNLKSILPGPSHLSLPTTVSGNDVELAVARTELAEDLALSCGEGILRVRRYVLSSDRG